LTAESSPAAWRFAIRANTALCRLLGGLLNIDSALTLIRFPRRDNADDFFAIVFLSKGMHNKKQGIRNRSNRVPPLFALHDAVPG
jgi:hypothetical protein